MTDNGRDAQLVEVRLLRLPLAVQARSDEHHQELLREFSHIAHSDTATVERIPARLIKLVDRLTLQYEPFTGEARRAIDAARDLGQPHVDISYRVPADTVTVLDHLERELDEADMFCRTGDLLTLAAPDDVLAFRNWFIDEFRRQIHGEAPRSWDDYVRV